jgi:hypothetical protein
MKNDNIKASVITWLAALPENSREYERVCSIYQGEEPQNGASPWYSLKEVSKLVRRNVVWLSKLGVQEVGTRLGGRLAYHLEDVVEFLKSDRCAQRIRDIHEERVCREQAKKARVA